MSAELPEGAAAGAFTKKLGPFPGFVWVLLIVGVAYGVYWWRKNHAATATAAAPAATAAPAIVDGGYVPLGTNANTGPVGTGTVTTYPQGSAAPATNATWAAQAANYLIGTGSYDPAAVQNALSKYTNGTGTLSAQEQAIVNTAVKQFGIQPEGVLPVNATVTTNDYTGHTYTVQQGDTLYGILSKFYGNQDPTNIVEQGVVTAAGNNLAFDPKSGAHIVTPGQQIMLYKDAQDAAHGNPDSFHWTGN